MEKILKNIKRVAKENPSVSVFTDWYSYCVNEDLPCKELRVEISKELKKNPNDQLYELWRNTLKTDARDDLDSFLLFVELDRENKFYTPRRKQLLPIVKELQRLEGDELDLLCISMPPGTGKTATATFFICWLVGRHPELGILVGSHNSAFLRGLYEECLRILSANEGYLWKEVFGWDVVKTNAQDMKIDVKKARRFSSLQFRSISGENAGLARAQQLLYCDDLISGIEEALSIDRLNSKWQKYTDDLRQRKEGKCKELHIATRWSVHDVIGRLEDANYGNPRAKFITVPALNENDESNFDYGGEIGFSTEFYHNQRNTMDDVSWRAVYMNEPIEREGLLYNRDELNTYYDLPSEEPDMVLAVCDTANGGGDDTVMPIFYVYDNRHYLVDCVCSNQLPEITDNLCANMLVKYKVKSCRFESNSAGGRTADKVEEIMKSKLKDGQRPTHITKKYTTSHKETKIIVESSWIKENCYFPDSSTLKPKTPMNDFMNKMCAYTQIGKNKHDDVVDALAQYSQFVCDVGGAKAVVMRRFF